MSGSISVQIVTAIDGSSGLLLSNTAPTPTGAVGASTQGAGILGGAQMSVTLNAPSFSSFGLGLGYDTGGLVADGVGFGADVNWSNQPTINFTMGFGLAAIGASGVTTMTTPLVQACPAMVPMS